MIVAVALPALLLASLPAASTAPRAAVVVRATGFAAATIEQLEAKIASEVESTGAQVWSLPGAHDLRPECLRNEGCTKEVLHAAQAARLVWVDLLRVGARAQISCQLFDDEGRSIAQVERSAAADQLLGSAHLLPSEVTSALAEFTRASSPPPPPEPTPQPSSSAPGGTERSSESAPLPPMAVAGLLTTSAGALLALGGVAVIPGQLATIRDSKSLGTEKEGAANAVALAGTLGAVGAAAAIAGGVLIWLSLPP